jgi:hypothetical protein
MVALLIITLGVSQAEVEQVVASTQTPWTDMLDGGAKTARGIET